MKTRHLIVFLVLVILPLGSALILGSRSLSRSSEERQLRTSANLLSRLEDLARRCQGIETGWESAFRRLAQTLGTDTAALRAASSDNPRVRQVFLVNRTGHPLYPTNENASQAEFDFLTRSQSFLARGWLPARPEGGQWPVDGGWYRWYWQDGLQWVFWAPRREGIIGLDVNRSAMLADLAGALEGPVLESDQSPFNRVRVMDVQGRVFV